MGHVLSSRGHTGHWKKKQKALSFNPVCGPGQVTGTLTPVGSSAVAEEGSGLDPVQFCRELFLPESQRELDLCLVLPSSSPLALEAVPRVVLQHRGLHSSFTLHGLFGQLCPVPLGSATRFCCYLKEKKRLQFSDR